MTEAQEGLIVRTIQRLEILLREVKTAIKLLGNIFF